MKCVKKFLTYQQLVRVSKQVINTWNNIALISPVLFHFKQTGRVIGSLDPGLIHDTPSTLVVILSRCDKSFLSMKYDSAKCYPFNIFQVKNWFILNIWIKTKHIKSSVLMTVSVRIFYMLQKFHTCFVTCNTKRV